MLEFTNEQLSRISLVVFTFQNAAFVLLMRGSKLANTHYNSTVAVMVTETLKVPFTVALLCYEKGGVGAACSQMHKDIVLQPMDTLKISIPALLYTVQNNALFVAVENLEAALQASREGYLLLEQGLKESEAIKAETGQRVREMELHVNGYADAQDALEEERGKVPTPTPRPIPTRIAAMMACRCPH